MVGETLIPIGRVQVATDLTMASAIRGGGEAAEAVDERITPALAAFPDVAAAAAAAAGPAVGAAVAGLQVLQFVRFGLNVNTPRPAGNGPKWWMGEGIPVNMRRDLGDRVIEERTDALLPAHSYIGADLASQSSTDGSGQTVISSPWWLDSVGSAHFTQPNQPQQPPVATINTIKVMHNRGGVASDTPRGTGFDATALGPTFRNAAGNTVMALMRRTGVQDRAIFQVSTGVTQGNHRLLLKIQGGGKLQVLCRSQDAAAQVGLTTAAIAPDGVWFVVTVITDWSHGIVRLRMNGAETTVAVPVANSSDTAPVRCTWGAISTGVGTSIDGSLAGEFAEQHVWASALAGSDLTTWEARMNALKARLEAVA